MITDILPKAKTHRDQLEPSNEIGDLLAEKRLDEMGGVALRSQNMESEADQVATYDFVKDNIICKYDPESREYKWKLSDGTQPYAQAYQQEIMESIPEQLRSEALAEGILDVMRTVAPGKTFDNEFAFRMIKENPSFLIIGRELFPDFVFDMNYVRAMVSEDQSYMLMSNWQLIEANCLQEAVDLVHQESRYAVYGVIGELAQKVHISRELLIGIAEDEPDWLLELVQQGQFPEVKKDTKIIRQLISFHDTWGLIDAGIFDELTIQELNQLLQLRPYVYKARMFTRLQQAGRIHTLDDFVEAIEVFGIESIIGEVSKLPREIQSHIFQNIVTQPGADWMQYVAMFTSLSDDDYIFILDSMPLIDKNVLSTDKLRDLFSAANDQLRNKFELIITQMKDQRLRDKEYQEQMNWRRQQQFQAEQTYFEAGSISVEVRDYHEPLNADDIIEALERNGCVRMAGDIREIAGDASRVNTMTCVAGSKDELTTSNLGEESFVKSRKTVTEHQALQQFMEFIQDLPDSSYSTRESLGTELTYIGEREYGEAVEGIALYWKWFLEKDPESQLYIGAVVSAAQGTTKSDVYMLDRILAHFSDDELAKYKGRILTDKDKVTQEDPEKVKAVLIDDWTISGSQLRGAYGTFIRDYPHLAKSIEIQLIASDRERVALGIEDVTGIYHPEGVFEKSVPTKVRAYYVAHTADNSRNNNYNAHITGSHSSVDFGFTSAIARSKDYDTPMPLIAAVIRPYRQKGYKSVNIDRLKRINRGLSKVVPVEN